MINRMINVSENSIFNQKMTVIVQLNIKQIINHVTRCSVKAIHKLWIRYFNTNPRIRQIAFVCVQKIFSTRYNTHAHRLSDTNSWISPNDERDWLLQSSATPISFTINLLYRVCALADDDGTREIGVLGVDFHWRQSLTIPGTIRAPVAPYADTKADNRLLKRKPSKYESPLISYTGITLMKLTNAGTMDRETLPWLSVLNRQFQSPRTPTPCRVSVNLYHSSRFASDATRRDETRHDAPRYGATLRHRRKSGDVKHVATSMKKAARSAYFSDRWLTRRSAMFRIIGTQKQKRRKLPICHLNFRIFYAFSNLFHLSYLNHNYYK